MLLWLIGTRSVTNEKVIYSSTSGKLLTSRYFLVDVPLWRQWREPVAAEIRSTTWNLGWWYTPLLHLARVHALETAVHVAIVAFSCLSSMCHMRFGGGSARR